VQKEKPWFGDDRDVCKMSIPKAGQIDVPDAPDIHYSELVQQILTNVSNQIEVLDNELLTASASDKIGFLLLLFTVYQDVTFALFLIYRWKNTGSL